MPTLDFQITVFSDPQGEAAAKVYVVAVPPRGVTDEELAAYRLSGQIVGPTCKYSSTLQSKIPFRHRGFTPCGNRTALVAEAVVPDPCYWSTELPFLYRAVGEVTGGATGSPEFDQVFGIRTVGTSRNRFTLNGNVWVPRGVLHEQAADAPLADWRDTATMMVVDEPTPSLCREASETGVLVAALVGSPKGTDAELWLRVGAYPCLTLCASFAEPHDRRELETAARNVLFGRSLVNTPDLAGDEGARFCLLPVLGHAVPPEVQERIGPILNRGLPVLAMRPLEKPTPLAAARAECDRLQRDLVGVGEFAGYIV